MEKICAKCKILKNIIDFSLTKRSKDGYQWWCKECMCNSNNNHYLKNREEILKCHKNSYGITFEEYKKLLDEQNGVCAICGNYETSKRNGKLKDLAIDHNHKTGKIRGLLCHSCNSVLGYAKDNSKILKSAICYLNKKEV